MTQEPLTTDEDARQRADEHRSRWTCRWRKRLSATDPCAVARQWDGELNVTAIGNEASNLSLMLGLHEHRYLPDDHRQQWNQLCRNPARGPWRHPHSGYQKTEGGSTARVQMPLEIIDDLQLRRDRVKRLIVLLVWMLLPIAAFAQPVCGPGTNPPLNRGACQAPAQKLQPTDILLGQQATEPNAVSQRVQISQAGVVNAAPYSAMDSTTARTANDRPADVCNIQDQMEADNDATTAFARCVATGKGTIWFPPGVHVVRTLTPTHGGHNLPPAGFVVDGKSHLAIEASGAIFLMADAIQPGSNSFFVPYNDAKDIVWHGGTFVLNPHSTTTSVGNPLLNGMCWESTTNVKISGVTMFSNSQNASAFCGVYGFKNVIENSRLYGFSIGADLSYNEGLTISDNYFQAGVLVSVGVVTGSDPPTYDVGVVTNPDGSPRPLRNGQTNSLEIINNTILGYHTGIAITDANGVLVDNNSIAGPATPYTTGNNAGVLVNTDAQTKSQGFVTQNVTITHNTITGMGNSTTSSGNAGVLLNDAGVGLKGVDIAANAIYDNCGDGIGHVAIDHTTDLTISDNDFKTRGGRCMQAASIAPLILGLFAPDSARR